MKQIPVFGGINAQCFGGNRCKNYLSLSIYIYIIYTYMHILINGSTWSIIQGAVRLESLASLNIFVLSWTGWINNSWNVSACQYTWMGLRMCQVWRVQQSHEAGSQEDPGGCGRGCLQRSDHWENSVGAGQRFSAHCGRACWLVTTVAPEQKSAEANSSIPRPSSDVQGISACDHLWFPVLLCQFWDQVFTCCQVFCPANTSKWFGASCLNV